MNFSNGFKVSHYFPNGEGRDQYISTTNGGFFTNTFPYKFKEEARTFKVIHSKSVPRLNAKPLKYNCNGSGRDTYVGYNHGGLFSAENKYSFYKSLRSSGTPMPTLKIINKKLAISQKSLAKRLSEPKKTFYDKKT